MNKVKLALAAWIAALLAGLYCSLMVVTALASVDPDSSHSLLLWYGIREHGLAWLLDWKFTQDNWLLSLFPWHFLGYFVAGPTPAVALLGGWLIFVASACTAGLLAWQLQARRAAFVIPPVLLFLGLHAHIKGLAAYSTTHNITNLYGLLALVLVVRWLQHRSRITLLCILGVLFAGALSDPWMVAAWNLPLAIATVFLLVSRSGGVSRTDSASLLVVNLFCIAAVMTRGFGLPDFFPAMEFQSGGAAAIVGNFSFLFRELGGLLNLVPGHASNLLLPAVLSLLVAGSWLLLQLARSYAVGQLAHTDLQFFVITGFFSIGGVTLAFALNDSATFSLSARFLINVPYVLVTGLGVLLERNWTQLRNPERGISAALVLLFVLAGASSTFAYWRSPVMGFNAARVTALVDFLRAENLTYGYGPYWGASANPVTAVSGEEIIMRPVTFDPTTGVLSDTWRAQTSRRWYRPDDIPAGQQEYFVFVVADGEECADPELCIAGLTRQFGPPLRLLAYGSAATVLVWDKPLNSAWTFTGR